MKRNTKLSEILAKSAGLAPSDVDAVFWNAPDLDFQITFHAPSAIEFRMSDYLMGAPESILADIFCTIRTRAEGGRRVYSRQTIRYLHTITRIRQFQDCFILRSRTIPKQPYICTVRDVSETIKNLDTQLLMFRHGDIRVMWASGHNDVMSIPFRVIALSPKWDRSDVPEFVFEYRLYSLFCRIWAGLSFLGPEYEQIRTEELLNKHPRREEASGWIAEHMKM